MSDIDYNGFKKGVRLLFGLEQQGHIPLVEEKLKEWRPCPFYNENTFYIWKEIAQEIGWLDYAVCEDYIRYLKRGKEDLQAKVKELEEAVILIVSQVKNDGYLSKEVHDIASKVIRND